MNDFSLSDYLLIGILFWIIVFTLVFVAFNPYLTLKFLVGLSLTILLTYGVGYIFSYPIKWYEER